MILTATPPSQGVALAVSRCDSSSAGGYCSLRHLHTVTSPAKRRTTRLAIGYASLNSRAALDVSTYISYCTSENVCSLLKAVTCCSPVHVLCMVWKSPAHCHAATHRYPHGRAEPPCRTCWPYQQTALSPSQTGMHLPSEDHRQSTPVHVIRITLEMVSAKVRESKYLASDSSHCSAS